MTRISVPPGSRGAFFLDRDGVNNRRIVGGYVTSWALFEFLPGAIEGISLLTRSNLPVFVVTNQACIGRNLLTSEALEAIHERMCLAVEAAGGRIAGIYVCPHRPDEGCECRKPKPGLLLRAALEHEIDLAQSWMIGDSVVDVLSGSRAGCRTVLIGSAHRDDEQHAEVLQASGIQPNACAKSLLKAVNLYML